MNKLVFLFTFFSHKCAVSSVIFFHLTIKSFKVETFRLSTNLVMTTSHTMGLTEEEFEAKFGRIEIILDQLLQEAQPLIRDAAKYAKLIPINEFLQHMERFKKELDAYQSLPGEMSDPLAQEMALFYKNFENLTLEAQGESKPLVDDPAREWFNKLVQHQAKLLNVVRYAVTLKTKMI